MSDDPILWRRFKQGDQKAFEALFLHHHRPLFQYGSKMLRDRQVLDDCIQELFLELWDTRERLTDVVSVRAYLFRALKFKLARAIKKRAAHSELSEEGTELLAFSYETELIARQTDADQRERLLRSVRQLTRRQQEVIYLRFYNQMSYEEISVTMDISYQAVVNLVSQALKALRVIYIA
ncbi:RNA polymerase sigma factor [Chitinophaga sp. GCM10012297]|uniref:Sigma-70 family RNA polymerase sigma factor n=1 Tax=Chitinophaga chungangae TaxID=2821488 RepID=A0ABS3YH99_9BACT|nr:sigma-70 family RNA polymerase sigma factor [Chitinophaga chungangae]MBO9154056.1 sigma-70 family RNA polymerase sigma factor [Chitinophaga chungangae]